jgi:hypothetical protein
MKNQKAKTVTSKNISKMTAPLPSTPIPVKADVAAHHDAPTEVATADAQPAPATQTSVAATKATKPAKPATKAASPRKAAKPDKVAKKPLNFKVPADFRREFKTYASTHDLKLNRLLELAFESYRKQRGD